MWVKICANTNLEDAKLAAELGADAVGFVFAESTRQVTSSQVAAITSHLPVRVECVGVFSSHDAEEIARIATEAGLAAVQLHAGLDENLIQRLAEKFAGKVEIVQTLHWVVGNPESADRLAGEFERAAKLGLTRILVDSKVGMAGGGTGVSFDWDLARKVFSAAPSGLRLIVAGGLNSENVGQAITSLAPWGVDVASGVEASPGRKDPARLAQFIENARWLEKP